MPSYVQTTRATVGDEIVKILCPPGIYILSEEDR